MELAIIIATASIALASVLLTFIAIAIRRMMTRDIRLVFKDGGTTRVITIKKDTLEREIVQQINKALDESLTNRPRAAQMTLYQFEKYVPAAPDVPAPPDYSAKEVRASHVEVWLMQKDTKVESKRRYGSGRIHVTGKRMREVNQRRSGNIRVWTQKHDEGLAISEGM